MKKLRFLLCLCIISALVLPYAVFADDNIEYGYGEGIVSDPLDLKQTDTFSLAEASGPLTENEAALLKYIVSKIPELKTNIEIPKEYHISRGRFVRIYQTYMGSLLQFEHPEIFYLENSFSYRFMQDDPHETVTELNLRYRPEYAFLHTEFNEVRQEEVVIQDGVNIEAIRKAQAEIEAEIENISAGTENMTALEKALYVHDYIVANYEYDVRVYSDEEGVDGNRTLDKMVEEKKGVCQGYTYLYMVAMQKLGIECVAVPTDELHHVWNKIKLDGEWYNVDVTFDDPISDMILSSSHQYFLVNDEEIKQLDPSNIKYEYYYYIDDNGDIILDEDGNPAIFTKEKENSSHIRWNSVKWDGSPIETSASAVFSASPLQAINGVTAYVDGKFFCTSNNIYQHYIYEVIFEAAVQILRERCQLPEFYWFSRGQHSQYYSFPDPDNPDRTIPYYSSAVAEYNGKVYVNSPDSVYEFDPVNYSLNKIYEYDGIPDPSKTYFYGLRVEAGGLKAEYAEDPYGDVTLIDIPVPTTIQEEFPKFEEPLPVDKPVVEYTEVTDVDEETKEEVTNYEVTIAADVPETVKEAVGQTDKTITVSVAKYSDAGALIGFETVELDENNEAKVMADKTCDMIKTFIWAGFIMPLSEVNEVRFSQQ